MWFLLEMLSLSSLLFGNPIPQETECVVFAVDGPNRKIVVSEVVYDRDIHKNWIIKVSPETKIFWENDNSVPETFEGIRKMNLQKIPIRMKVFHKDDEKTDVIVPTEIILLRITEPTT